MITSDDLRKLIMGISDVEKREFEACDNESDYFSFQEELDIAFCRIANRGLGEIMADYRELMNLTQNNGGCLE